jgi:lipid A 3-O-deacylase
MRIRLCFVCLMLCAATAAAQTETSTALHKGATELAFWAGGGSGVGHSSETQMMNAGLRVGKVLTAPHGPGVLRGSLEYAADVAPLYLFFQDRTVNGVRGRQTVYGGSITPLVMKWNFTSGKKVAPYVGVEGSAIFTSQNVPAGDTSRVNFASGATCGLQILTSSNRALSFSAHVMHISNASIGNHNPGVNVAMQFRVGYQWWK